MSILAQTGDQDLALSNGRLTVVTDRNEAAAIKLGNKFRSVLGEWFLDTRIGIPYFDLVWVKNPDLKLIGQVFRRVCLSTPPIVDVLTLELTLSPARALAVSFALRTEDGSIITGGSGEPFIVETK